MGCTTSKPKKTEQELQMEQEAAMNEQIKDQREALRKKKEADAARKKKEEEEKEKKEKQEQEEKEKQEKQKEDQPNGKVDSELGNVGKKNSIKCLEKKKKKKKATAEQDTKNSDS